MQNLSFALTTTTSAFTENKGQLKNEEQILFYTQAKQHSLLITKKGFSYVFKQTINNLDTLCTEKRKQAITNWQRVDVELVNANILTENIFREEKSDASYSFYYPHCSQGIHNVYSYQKISIKNIYPHIDWVFYEHNGEYKYDFIVNPGGDPSIIQLQYHFAEKITLNTIAKKIMITTPLSTAEEGELVCYQQDKPIESHYLLTNNVVSFNITSFNKSQTLIIDPPLKLYWSTYMGGSDYDGGYALTTDNSGNVYATGYTYSSAFPVMNAAYGTYTANADVFAAKFDGNGVMQWCTFYGGTNYEFGNDIAVDNSGNVYVTGESDSPTLPIQNLAGAYNQATMGNQFSQDAFILKLNSTSGASLWSTFFGGGAEDRGLGIACDNTGNIFLTGWTYNTITTKPNGTAYTQTPGGTLDGFIAKFNTANALDWCTNIGGSDNDDCHDVNTDANGNVFVVGGTRSTNFPTQNNGTGYQITALQSPNFYDSFICEFDNNGNYLWGTLYGGDNGEKAYSVYCDAANNAYMFGTTGSTNLFTQSGGAGSYVQTFGGVSDNFIVKFNKQGALRWATYFGGAQNESNFYWGAIIDGDKKNNLFISSENLGGALPIQNVAANYNQAVNNGGRDAYVAQFDTSGVHIWSTYFGGNANETENALAVDNQGCVFLTGVTQSASSFPFPLSNPPSAFNQTNIGSVGFADSYMAKFCTQQSLSSDTTFTSPLCFAINDGTATAIPVGGNPNYTYSWNNGQTNQVATGLAPGTYSVTITDANGISTTNTVTLTAPVAITYTVTSVTATCAGNDGSLSATVSGGAPNYTYSWSGTAQTTSTITGMGAGSYTLTITDNNGCTVASSETIGSTGGPTATLTSFDDATCSGYNDGVANVTSNGTNLIYSWNTSPVQTTASATGLAAGDYTLTVNDQNNCSTTVNVTISEPSPIIISGTPKSASCSGVSDGQIAIGSTNGGSGTYSYSWTNGITTSNISNLPAGNYTLTATDSDGCISSQTFSISNYSTLIADITATPLLCANDSDASANANINGGTGPYSYTWNTGQTDANISNIGAGNYIVTISEPSGCFDTDTIVIINPSAITSNISSTIASYQSSDGTAMVNASGGSPTLTYSWNTTPVQTTNNISSLASGWYRVMITDANGCSVIDSVFVNEEQPCGELFIPTAFSPNGDGQNDTYQLRGKCASVELLEIFNRWGEKVFTATNIDQSWNGTYQGKNCDPGIFVYYLNATSGTGEQIDKKGNITLVR